MTEIVDIFPILPADHTLVVMPSLVLLPNAMRVANEKGAYLLLLAKRDHLPGCFVAQVAHTALDTTDHLVLRSLKLLPAARVLLTASLFFSNPPVPHVVLAFEATNAAPRDDDGHASAGGHRSKVDFAEVHRCAVGARSMFGLWYLDAHMQFKAAIPDQRTG